MLCYAMAPILPSRRPPSLVHLSIPNVSTVPYFLLRPPARVRVGRIPESEYRIGRTSLPLLLRPITLLSHYLSSAMLSGKENLPKKLSFLEGLAHD